MILEHNIMIHPRGLKNLGNTCFLNSILQAISSCPSFIEYLQVIANSNYKYNFSIQLLKCIRELRQKSKSYFPLNSTNILNTLISSNPGFKGYDEQDALEAFETIISLLKDEKQDLLNSTQYENHHSIVDKIEQFKSLSLEGMICSHIQCKECLIKDKASLRYNPVRHQIFITLPLPVPLSAIGTCSIRTTSNSVITTSMAYNNALNLKGGNTSTSNTMMFPGNNNNRNKYNSIYNCIEEYFKSESLNNVLCNSCSIKKTMSVLKHKQSLHSTNNSIYTSKSTLGIDDGEKEADINTEENMLQILIKKSEAMSIIGSTDCFIQDITENINQSQVQQENADLDMMWLVSKQSVYSDVLRHSSISRLPKLLCLYICRRSYDELTGKIRKLSTYLDFPLKLNMKNFLNVDANFKHSFNEKSIIDYSLKAVIAHTGNADAGHYVAYCLINDKPIRQWCYFSDESYKLVSESDVLKVQATMLFYDSIY